MKDLLLSLIVCVCGSLPLQVQTATVSETFQLGTRQVRVPPPQGFIDTATKFDQITQRLATAEDPGNEAMAAYVPDWLVPKLTEKQNIDLPLYAKFSVPRRAKAVDCSPENFAEVIDGFKTAFPELLDPNSKLSKESNANVNKSLEELWGKNVDVQISGQKNLGYFQHGENVFSGLMALNLQVSGKTVPLIASASLLRVNQRLIFLYIFKVTSATEDMGPMIDLTKKWTAAVISANK